MAHNSVKACGSFRNGKQDHVTIELGGMENETLFLGRQRQVYVNSLSPRQMESLSAVCETLLPSINFSDDPEDDSVVTFFQTSASMAGTPQHIGGMISERMEHPRLWLMRFTLWFLSTWMGSLILCGRASLRSQFPYVQRFSQMPLEKREKILLSWSSSYFSLLRMLFVSLKFLTLLIFFTQVDEEDNNLSWKAIDYCGPDPDFKNQIHNKEMKNQESEEATDASEEPLFGPLYKGLINPKQPQNKVVGALRRSNFRVSIFHQKSKRTLPNSLQPSLMTKCDAVVVGSGSGGGVVAGILAKSGYKVLVIEKGKYAARTNLSLLEGPTMDQMYLGSGLLATKDMGVVLLAGSTVGGGSTINWSASIRTPLHVRKEWSERHGLELFESNLYKEAMDTVCGSMGVQSEVDSEGFNNMVLRKGCEELGYPVNNIPRNSAPDHYCGWCCLGCKDGRKKGTSETWLVDLVNSGNGAILPECEVIEVLHTRKEGRDRSIATGIALQFEYNGVKETYIVESKVIIVSCGALCTPSLLKRSGLKNPNIGKNLHIHPVTMAWGYFPEKSLFDTWPEAEKKSYEGGIMTAMSSVVGNFEGSGYGAVIQTPALHPGMFSVLMPWLSGIDHKRRMCKFSRTAHVFALGRDKGSGQIVSPSSISYQMDKMDEVNLHKGLEKVLRILAAAGAEEIGTHHRKGKVLNVKKATSHEFERFVKEESSRTLSDLSTPICSAHQMGSCRMGVDPKVSVVNPYGETWDVEGLYVADSSVFPTALGVNPMVTIQAIAYCTAQSILESLRRRKVRH